MLTLLKIAITGGIASGKTSVCQFFAELGAYVVNADSVVHELLNPHTDLGQQIISQLGHEILENGKINRKKIADQVFKDATKLKKLEKVIHPIVLEYLEQRYQEACKANIYTSFVVEIPLLFEIGAEKFYDVTITVLADEKQAKERFQRQGFSASEYALRMKRQIQPKQKAMRSHYFIQNNGSLADLQEEVVRLNRKIHKEFS